MKQLYCLLSYILIVLLQFSCTTDVKYREKASDRIIHIEDSIQYVIPVIPKLCDEIMINKSFVDIGDCRLYIETEGNGIPIVLINGGPGGTHHSFHPQFSNLKDAHQIIYYDQRGTGQSDFEADDAYSFKQAVNDLELLRQKLNIDKWVVCGFSYGGGLAQYYSLSYPDHVLGMVLISSIPVFEDNGFEDVQDIYLSSLEIEHKKIIITEFLSGRLGLKPFLYNLNLNGDWKRQNYYKPTDDEMLRSALYEWINDDNFNFVMSESYALHNFKGLFNNCPIPTLIFEGKNDLTWGPNKVDIFKANHPNAKLVYFENSAHQSFIDEPFKFFSSLKEFTETLSNISSTDLSLWKDSTKDYLSTH